MGLIDELLAVLSFHVDWGILLALEQFLGGLGAGAYIFAAVADILGGKKWEKLSKLGVYLSWPMVVIGLVLLIIDLGRPELNRPSHLLNVLNNPLSMMAVGSFLLIAFIVMAVLTSFLWLSRWQTGRLRMLIEIVGVVLAVGVAIYAGLLLSLARGTPFWGSPFLPWLFTISAALTGLVLVGLCQTTLGMQLFPRFTAEPVREKLYTIGKIVSALIAVELITIFLYLASVSPIPSAAVGIASVLTGNLSPLFWGMIIIGLIIPLFIGIYSTRLSESTHIRIATISFILVLIGSFLLRYVVLIAGQL